MQIFISTSADKLDNVLQLMINTIQLPKGSKNTYGSASTSCYAQVAKYLRTHFHPTWQLMFFGGHADNVSHCCLYSDSGEPIVDSYLEHGGKLEVLNNKLHYTTPKESYPVLMSVTMADFKKVYL